MTSHRPRHVVLCLDNSGSIGAIIDPWRQALRLLARSLSASSAPISYSLTLWSSGYDARIVGKPRMLGDELATTIDNLSSYDLQVGSSTLVEYARLMASDCINDDRARAKKEDTLVVIMTDGNLYDTTNGGANPRAHIASWELLNPSPTVVLFTPVYGDMVAIRNELPEVGLQGQNVCLWELSNVGYLVLAMATTIGVWLDPALTDPNRCAAEAEDRLRKDGILRDRPDTLPVIWQLSDPAATT